jgi:hypothetical protein
LFLANRSSDGGFGVHPERFLTEFRFLFQKTDRDLMARTSTWRLACHDPVLMTCCSLPDRTARCFSGNARILSPISRFIAPALTLVALIAPTSTRQLAHLPQATSRPKFRSSGRQSLPESRVSQFVPASTAGESSNPHTLGSHHHVLVETGTSISI